MFDGYNFITYGIDDGLGSLIVNSIAEDQQGQLWVGTTRGISRLIDNPQGAPALVGEMSASKRKKFLSYRVGNTNDSNNIGRILFDEAGTLSCTSDEIYRASLTEGGDLTFEVAIAHKGGWSNFSAFVDSRHRLWFGLHRELFEFVNGEVIRYGTADGLPMELTINKATQLFDERITGIAEDRGGRLFVSNDHDIFEFVEPASGNAKRGGWKKVPPGLPSDHNLGLLIGDAQGRLLIGTNKGLIRRAPGGQVERVFPRVTAESGVSSLLEDRQGNLWFGVWHEGVYRLANAFILSYTRFDGLPGERVLWLAENRDGHLYALTGSTGVAEIVEDRVVPIPASRKFPLNAAGRMLYDSRGDYWLPTSAGLFRIPGPKLKSSGGEKFTGEYGARSPRQSLGMGLYEDPAGRIWCGAYRDPAIYVFDPRQKQRRGFQRIPIAGILSAPSERIPDVLHCAIADPSGALWFGWQVDIARYRDGKIELLRPTDGLPQTAARAFLIDSRGWLWIALAGEASP